MSRNATLSMTTTGRTTVMSAKPLSLVPGDATERAFRTSVSGNPAATLPIEYTTAMTCDAPAATPVIRALSPATPFTETIVIGVFGCDASRSKPSEPVALFVTVNEKRATRVEHFVARVDVDVREGFSEIEDAPDRDIEADSAQQATEDDQVFDEATAIPRRV